MGFEDDRKRKVARALQRQKERAEEVAAPALEAYQEYLPKAMEAQWQALQLPGVKGIYAGEESAMRGRLSRQGMGGGGALERGSRALRQEQAANMARMQFGQAGQYGVMGQQALGAGSFGHQVREGGEAGITAYRRQRLASAKAGEQAKRTAARQLPFQIGEAAFDVGMGIATGGASVPGSVAKWGARGGGYGQPEDQGPYGGYEQYMPQRRLRKG